jgi:hypothetical protein
VIATDLHIHSCLSPCGDNAMVPCDLVGMAAINGLQLIALTDHNTARNCPAAAAAAKVYGVGFIPGMELTTSEDIHAVCLFPDLEAALDFDRYIYSRLPDVPNRPEIFGEQILCGPAGDLIGFEPRLLLTACSISIVDLPGVVEGWGGVCYPAHVDREGNGLLAILGGWPPEMQVRAAEIAQNIPPGIPAGIKLIRASDAHSLLDIPTKGFPLPLASPDFRGLAGWING